MTDDERARLLNLRADVREREANAELALAATMRRHGLADTAALLDAIEHGTVTLDLAEADALARLVGPAD